MKTFKKICKMEQPKLKKWLERCLKAKYGMNKVVNEDGFLYVKGNCPILLTAHMDTVHKENCREIITFKTDKGETVLTSPQGIGGDDRCGIWIIWQIICKTKYRPSILFCEDEEIGGVGSNKFCKTKWVKELESLKYLVELDRAHDNDAVYYDCGNAEFKKYIKKATGYIEDHGSFSDISHLSPECDVASVNLSCGYYRAHTTEEYVVFEEMWHTYKVVKKLCAEAKECDSYDYQEVNPFRYSNNWLSEMYDGGAYKSYNYYNDTAYYEINYNDAKGEDVYCVEASSYEEALGMFFLDKTDRCYQDIIDVMVY